MNLIKKVITHFFLVFLLLTFSLNAFYSPFNTEKSKNNKYKDTFLGFGFFATRHCLYPEHFLKKNIETINLSTDQLNDIDHSALKYKQFYIMHSAKIKIHELELMYLLNNPKLDRKLIQSEIKKLGEMKTQLVIEHFRYLLKLKEILTTKQLLLLKQIK